MQLYYFSNPIRSFLNIFILICLTACGSYQNSSVMTEDIYENDKVVAVQVLEVQQLPNSQNTFYKNAFSEKSKEYELVKTENDILFTEAEQYTDANSDNDSTDVSYGPWGDNKTNVTINMLGGHSMYSIRGSRNNYPSWLMNSGYGYGNVFGYGLNSWGYGYDMYWTKPYWNNFHNGLFYPYWNNMGYGGYGYGGYGYGGYGYGGYGYGYGLSNNFYRNTNVAYVSGRRGSTSLSSRASSFTSRASKDNYTTQSRISDNMINSSLRDRTSRVERLNETLAAKPNYNSNPSRAAKPSNSKPNNWRPSNSNNNSRPRDNNSNSNSKPSYNSKPSFNSSSPSRSGNSSSSSRSGNSSPSRSGKIGGN
jgi:hypothetical protein